MNDYRSERDVEADGFAHQDTFCAGASWALTSSVVKGLSRALQACLDNDFEYWDEAEEALQAYRDATAAVKDGK